MYTYNNYFNAHCFFYLARERVMYFILFVAGGARWSPPDLFTCVVIPQRRLRMGTAGMLATDFITWTEKC